MCWVKARTLDLANSDLQSARTRPYESWVADLLDKIIQIFVGYWVTITNKYIAETLNEVTCHWQKSIAMLLALLGCNTCSHQHAYNDNDSMFMFHWSNAHLVHRVGLAKTDTWWERREFCRKFDHKPVYGQNEILARDEKSGDRNYPSLTSGDQMSVCKILQQFIQ